MLLKLKSKIIYYKIAFFDLILPESCIICKNRTSREIILCLQCFKKIKIIKSSICPKCGLPYPLPKGEDHFCEKCLKNKVFFDKARQVGYYNGILKKTIAALKYNGKTYISSRLGKLMANKIAMEKKKIDYNFIFPIPLHIKKLKERGFNQGYLLAKEVGKILKIKVEFKNLSKILENPSQINLSKNERKKNVRGIFYLKNPAQIKNKKILLIDDVYTSGATVNECARMLKQGGATEVDVLTLARTA